MAPVGVPLDLYDAVRAAQKREKERRHAQSDMLVDAVIEIAHLRRLLRSVLMVAAGARHEYDERALATLREAARAIDETEETHGTTA